MDKIQKTVLQSTRFILFILSILSKKTPCALCSPWFELINTPKGISPHAANCD
jgi:hypothetical protein